MMELFGALAMGAAGAAVVGFIVYRRDAADRRRLLESITRLSHTQAPPELFAELSRRITTLERRFEGMNRKARAARKSKKPRWS